MKKFIWIVVILSGLFFASTFIALFIENPSFNLKDFNIFEVAVDKKIAIIPIYGMIVSENNGVDLFNTQVTSPNKIKIFIENVKSDDSIKAVIFDVNSPGGAVVPSQEIAQMVKELNKTKYAVIGDVGASGAYWISSACDKIIANPLSVTGSIGVSSSYLDYSGLFSKFGVNYNSLIAGGLKDIGSPYKNLSSTEREIMQKKLDIIHYIFASNVAENRNISLEQVSKLATGEFFLGVEAIKLGLVDELGNKETAINEIKQKLNVSNVQIVEYKEQKNILDILSKFSSYYIGQGIAAGLIAKGSSVSDNVEIKA